MKKIIALLLALMMTFSVASVAFATEGEATTTPDTEATEPAIPEDIVGSIEEALGDYKWILDLPFGVVPPALKIAKIALKFLKVYLKICDVFGLDPEKTAEGIFEYVSKAVEDYKNSQEAEGEESTTVPETTQAPAAA